MQVCFVLIARGMFKAVRRRQLWLHLTCYRQRRSCLRVEKSLLVWMQVQIVKLHAKLGLLADAKVVDDARVQVQINLKEFVGMMEAETLGATGFKPFKECFLTCLFTMAVFASLGIPR